jgi:hypothetical protein
MAVQKKKMKRSAHHHQKQEHLHLRRVNPHKLLVRVNLLVGKGARRTRRTLLLSTKSLAMSHDSWVSRGLLPFQEQRARPAYFDVEVVFGGCLQNGPVGHRAAHSKRRWISEQSFAKLMDRNIAKRKQTKCSVPRAASGRVRPCSQAAAHRSKSTRTGRRMTRRTAHRQLVLATCRGDRIFGSKREGERKIKCTPFQSETQACKITLTLLERHRAEAEACWLNQLVPEFPVGQKQTQRVQIQTIPPRTLGRVVSWRMLPAATDNGTRCDVQYSPCVNAPDL